jgi:hypothetical protein
MPAEGLVTLHASFLCRTTNWRLFSPRVSKLEIPLIDEEWTKPATWPSSDLASDIVASVLREVPTT